MQTPIQITFRDMPVSDAVEARCWKEARKLERLYDRVTNCHVTIAESHRRHRQGNLFDVHVCLTVPGKALIVTREPGEHHEYEEIDVAVGDAFDRMGRQLRDFANRRHDDVRHRGAKAARSLVTTRPHGSEPAGESDPGMAPADRPVNRDAAFQAASQHDE